MDIKCSGSGGGNSCRGLVGGVKYCAPAPPWKPGGGAASVFPWPANYKGPQGAEAVGSWGR
eukprot:8079375-Pyramimonas_sp.AAC.1